MAADRVHAVTRRVRRGLLRIGALMLAGSAFATAARARSVEVLTLRFRTADDLLPLLQPLVAPGGGVTGEGNRLFLRTTPANAREIRQLAAELDRPPRRLRLTARQDPPTGAASGGVLPHGDTQVDSTRAAAEPKEGVRRPHGARSAGAVTAESVPDVTEGAAAYLAMPTAVPFVFNRWQPQRDGSWVETPGLVHYGAVVGLNVRAFLRGEIVTLELEPDEATQPLAVGGRVARRVQSRLGEWFALGGAESRGSTAQAGVLSGAGAQALQRGLWLRIEDLGPAAPR